MSIRFVAVILIYLGLTPTLVIGRLKKPASSVSEERLHLQERNAKAKELLNYMNLEIDPCEDFYEYVCGKWANYNQPQPDSIVSVQNLLEAEVLRQLQSILDSKRFLEESTASGKAGNFYKSCIAAERTTSMRKDFLMRFVNQHGGLAGMSGTNWQKNFNWIHLIAKLRANYGLDILIGLEIDKDLNNGRGNIIILTEPKSTLIPAELCSVIASQDADLKDKAYANIEEQIAANMITWFDMNESDAKRFAGDLVAFEFQLCKKMRSDHTWRAKANIENEDTMETRGKNRFQTSSDESELYARRSAQAWTQNFDNSIDFRFYLNTIFEKTINDQIYMTSEIYFRHLANVIKISSPPTLSNYILYRALEIINFPIPDTITKRPIYCVEITLRYFTKVIGAYLQRFYRGETRDDVEFIFQEIKNALKDSVKTDWMNPYAKNAAENKVEPFKVTFPSYANIDVIDRAIGWQNYWQNLEFVMKFNAKLYLDRFNSMETNSQSNNIDAADLHIKLLPADSEIIVTWGVLHTPFYNYYYPKALKFAVLGQQIAGQLTSAFDEQGWNSMGSHRLDEEILEGFRNQSECFRAQYSNYLFNNPDMLHNASKIQEIMADSSGLNIAFKAYLNWLDSISVTEYGILSRETLPDVNFSNTQLFFIHFAQTRCMSKYEEEPPPSFLPMSRHTMERYNVNGPLSNNEEFAKEFNCIRGVEMNPDDKCVLFT